MWSAWIFGKVIIWTEISVKGTRHSCVHLEELTAVLWYFRIAQSAFVPKDKLNAWRKKGQIKGSSCCIQCIGQAVTKGHLKHIYWIWKTLTPVSECKSVSPTRCIILIILLFKIIPALIYQNSCLSCTLAVMAERNQPTKRAELSSIWRWDDSEPLRWTVTKLSGSAGLALRDTSGAFWQILFFLKCWFIKNQLDQVWKSALHQLCW